MITDQESKDLVVFRGPLYGILIIDLELQDQVSCHQFHWHSLHVIIITDQEAKDQVRYHSLHWNSAPCHHDH